MLLPETTHRVDQAIRDAQATGRVPSLVAAVVRDGDLVHVTGAGDLPTTNPDMQYRIGSISKTFTAALVLALRDEGRLALDDPLEAYLPGTPVGGVSLRQLLGHVGGVQREPDGDWWERSPGSTLDALLAGLHPEKLAHPPLHTFHYSNLAYGLLGAVVAPDSGLHTGRRISHVYAMDVPSYPKPLVITDAAINIAPTLAHKRDICQNAIDLVHAMGVERPRVAVLAAVETVTPAMPATLDAAALTVMAARGQITGGLVDGPLAFDNAVSVAAARTKGIVSDVAGEADILLAPDLEAGNMLAKQLIYLAEADAAGLAVGARVPIILTSRADALRVRLASSALARLAAARRASTLGQA